MSHRIIDLHGAVSDDRKRLAVTCEEARAMLVEARACLRAFGVEPSDALAHVIGRLQNGIHAARTGLALVRNEYDISNLGHRDPNIMMVRRGLTEASAAIDSLGELLILLDGQS